MKYTVKGWRSGESALLPPMWPGFKSRRRRHTWVEFVVGSLLCSERYFSGYSGFPLSSKPSVQVPIRPGIRYTKNHFVDVLSPNHYLFLYFFIYLFYSYSQYRKKISICLNKGREESVGKDHVSIVCARKYEMVRMT